MPDPELTDQFAHPFWQISQTYTDDATRSWSDGSLTLTSSAPSAESVYLSAATISP